jgi:peptide/nickel transport system permease protein
MIEDPELLDEKLLFVADEFELDSAPAGAATVAVATTKPPSAGRRIVRRFLAHRAGVIGLFVLIVLTVCAVFAPLLAPKDPDKIDLVNKYKASIGLLGTDDFGRDQLSRLIFGARASLLAALIVIVISAGVGVPMGMIAGFKGRWTDAVLSRINDALQSVPALIFALTVIAVLGPGLFNAMFAIGIVTIPRFFRVTRAVSIDVSGETFIEASHALGCSTRRTIFRHVLPNVLTPLTVQIALTAGTAVTAEAALSYLGLGVRAPTASWGGMLSNGSQALERGPYLVYAPGIMIGITVLAFMFVCDGLRQALGTHQIEGSEGV